jgi:hypothetical protein
MILITSYSNANVVNFFLQVNALDTMIFKLRGQMVTYSKVWELIMVTTKKFQNFIFLV